MIRDSCLDEVGVTFYFYGMVRKSNTRVEDTLEPSSRKDVMT